jgi:2-phosphosulfolactate phosphatase
VPNVEQCPPLHAGDAAVVFDVLRMSSAMTAAAAAGVTAIWPVATVEEARAAAARAPGTWLAGERNNVPPDGFHHGNSPVEWHARVPTGTRVVWTTTNGTRALAHVGGAGAVAVGALVNRRAAAAWVQAWLDQAADTRVWLVAAGRRGEPSPPDWWGVGSVATLLPAEWRSPAAEAAAAAFVSVEPRLEMALLESDEGLGLSAMGFLADVQWSAQVDKAPVLLVRESDGWLGLWS